MKKHIDNYDVFKEAISENNVLAMAEQLAMYETRFLIVQSSSTARNGKLRFYYKCAGRKKHKDCNLRVIRQQELDDFVSQVTYEVFCTDENITLIANKVLEVQAQRNKSDSVNVCQ